jgi:mRNA interferase MazF
VSSDRFNRSRIATIQVAPISTNTRRAAMPGSVFIAHGVAGLRRDCVVLAHQIATIDRGHLDGRIGMLPPSLMAQVDDALRLVLAL